MKRIFVAMTIVALCLPMFSMLVSQGLCRLMQLDFECDQSTDGCVNIEVGQNKHYIILSFDEASHMQNPANQAVQIMDEYGFKGVSFVVVGGLDLSKPVWSHIVAEGWEIGCHTWTHPDLNHVSAARLVFETRDAKARLEQLFHTDVISFAYPYSKGCSNTTVLAALQNAGFYYAREGWEHCCWDGTHSLHVTSRMGNYLDFAYQIQVAINNSLNYGIGAMFFHKVSWDKDPLNVGTLTPTMFRYCLDQVKKAGLIPVTFKEWDQIKYPAQSSPAVSNVYVCPPTFNPRIGQTTRIGYTLSERCYVTIRIYNSAGTFVTTLLYYALQAGGYEGVIWNGKTISGTTVPMGIYTIRIYVVDKAGNKATLYPITKTVTVL